MAGKSTGKSQSKLIENDRLALNTMMDTVREETVNGKPVYVNDFYALRRVIENEMSIVEFDLVLRGNDLDGLKFGRLPPNFIMAIFITEHRESENPEIAIRSFNDRLRQHGVADFFKARSYTNVKGLPQLTYGTYCVLVKNYPELFEYTGKDGKIHTYTHKEVLSDVNLSVRATILLCYHNRISNDHMFRKLKTRDEMLRSLAAMYNNNPDEMIRYRKLAVSYYQKLNYYDQQGININTLGPKVLVR